ncbi:hypothetical protein GYMLUDRAFT_41839 [Collybiopsis luxurians FD-317 M1]|uniref:Uncharacterized protein n=1 Tax=Collybiopsis luxurians FD-317 M1 TaxID=944289 RepID=A0A0D0BF30_9AGAR|nr:hypothetical protein GYMLUDRAFT_41839 [Collybiopsis luxurians FD-317 M1]
MCSIICSCNLPVLFLGIYILLLTRKLTPSGQTQLPSFEKLTSKYHSIPCIDNIELIC